MRERGIASVVVGAVSGESGLFYMSSISSVFWGVIVICLCYRFGRLVFTMIYFRGVPIIVAED